MFKKSDISLVLLVLMLMSPVVVFAGFNDENFDWKFSADYRFQKWEPDDIYGADLLTAGLNLVGLEIARSNGGEGFYPLLRYEFSPQGDSAAQSDLLEISEQEASGWERLLADLKWDFSSGNSVSFIYDKQTYLTSVQTNRDYWYFSGGEVTLLVPGEIVRSSTVMQDIQLLFGSPVFSYGVFSLDYEKPYSTDILSGQIGIYTTTLKSVGMIAKSEYKVDMFTLKASYKMGLQSDLTIGANTSAADLLGEYDSSLDFTEVGVGVKSQPFKGTLNLQFGVDYKIRSMGGDIQLTRDDVLSFYVNYSHSF